MLVVVKSSSSVEAITQSDCGFFNQCENLHFDTVQTNNSRWYLRTLIEFILLWIHTEIKSLETWIMNIWLLCLSVRWGSTLNGNINKAKVSICTSDPLTHSITPLLPDKHTHMLQLRERKSAPQIDLIDVKYTHTPLSVNAAVSLNGSWRSRQWITLMVRDGTVQVQIDRWDGGAGVWGFTECVSSSDAQR